MLQKNSFNVINQDLNIKENQLTNSNKSQTQKYFDQFQHNVVYQEL